MGVAVPVGTIGRLNKTWDAQPTLGVFEGAAKAWKQQLFKENLRSTNKMAAKVWNSLQRNMCTVVQ